MAFLLEDQNQGTRNDKQPHLAMRLPPTVLFHPDFDRRLRSCTESADPSLWKILFRKTLGKALAGLGFSTLTAGGDFHPALRTSAARNERPDRNMTPVRGHSKRFRIGKPHGPMPAWRSSWRSFWRSGPRRVKLTIAASLA